MPKTAENTAPTRRSARVASRGDVAKPEVKKPAAAKPKAPAKKPVSKDKEPEAKPVSASKDKTASKEKAAPKSKSQSNSKTPASKDKEPTAGENGAGAAEDAASGDDDKLVLGDVLPAITLQDQTGADVDVSRIAGERGVVFFLYPKADTPGCTNQACGYRDTNAEITALGYDVYGLSKDKPTAQQKWHTKKDLNYKLLSDPESKLIKRLGAFLPPAKTRRSHFIFAKGSGKLIDVAFVKPNDDAANVLAFIKKHEADAA